jgi:hypothetical protein
VSEWRVRLAAYADLITRPSEEELDRLMERVEHGAETPDLVVLGLLAEIDALRGPAAPATPIAVLPNGPLYTEDEAMAIQEATGERPPNVAPGTAGMTDPDRLRGLRIQLAARVELDALRNNSPLRGPPIRDASGHFPGCRTAGCLATRCRWPL